MVEVLEELLGKVSVNVTTRDATMYLLAKAKVRTVATGMMVSGIRCVLTTVSLEAAVALASEVGTGTLGPTAGQGNVGGVLVGWFRRRSTPPKLSKEKSKKCPKSWGSKEWKAGDNNGVDPL